MAKFDLEKYWDFRVWVKSQIAQLRALLSEYQQNGGGGGTGGGGDFDPNGTYPNVTVGNATKATTATTADKAVKDGGGKNIAENYALISDTVGKLGVLNSPVDRSAAIPNALTNAWGIDNTMFSVIIYERANSSATWVEKWNYATASVVQKTQVERGEATSNLFTSTRGYQVKVVVSTTTSNYNYIKALNLRIKTKDGTYSGNVDYTAYYGSSLTVAYNGSMGTWGANWSASFLETAAQNVEYIFNANRANASIVIRGYRICTNEPTNPTLIGKALKAYEADKATTADTATSANTAATAATAVNISDAPVLTATEDEQITVKVGNKTSNALTVPYAQRADFATDLSGRVEATPEVFTYRPSAGDKSIKDDNAFIRRVKGNSVVFNQLVKNALDQSGNNGWWSRQGANNVELNGSSIKLTFVSGTSTTPQITQKANFVLSHKYLVSCEIKSSASKAINCFLRESSDLYGNSVNRILLMPTDGQYQTIYTSTGGYPYVTIVVMYQVNDVGDSVTVSDIQLIDLTAMFGAGNEPTTVEEFRALYPNSYYPYHAGELRDLVCSGIKTVGFNEFNGTYARVLPNESYYLSGTYTSIGFTTEIGGATESISIPSNKLYTPTQLGYIYATGTDICINLHHTGYRDGEYTPYKEVTHSLPLSQITNGEPLRKAGSVYDEINETEYIRRVGVRGYATGDKDDATLLTDGRYTNYPLDEPVVTPIETPIDFNYYVEDFGTEEAILAEDSAPFSADIVYQFNAVDNIRQNRISIQKLNDIFSGSKGEYVRADGSWGYIADLKGNFFVKPTLKRIRTGISELSDTIQIIHPYLTEHIGDAKIVLMAVKRRGGSYYDRATNAKGRRKKRKAWGELHYAAMPNTEINHNTIEMPNGASFEEWQNVILTACGRIPEGLENAREPYNVNVDVEDLAEFFATNGAIFVGKTPVIRLGVALRIPNPNFIDYGNGNKMWDYNDVTGKWEYKYLYSDVAEVVVKSQMLRAGGYVLGLELI